MPWNDLKHFGTTLCVWAFELQSLEIETMRRRAPSTASTLSLFL